MHYFNRIAPPLAILGGVNWALVGVANVDLVAKVFRERDDADALGVRAHRSRDALLLDTAFHLPVPAGLPTA